MKRSTNSSDFEISIILSQNGHPLSQKIWIATRWAQVRQWGLWQWELVPMESLMQRILQTRSLLPQRQEATRCG